MDIKYLIAMIIGVSIFGLVLVMNSNLVSNIQSTQTVDGNAYNISGQTLTAFSTASGYQGFLVTIGILVVIIGALVGLTRMFA